MCELENLKNLPNPRESTRRIPGEMGYVHQRKRVCFGYHTENFGAVGQMNKTGYIDS